MDGEAFFRVQMLLLHSQETAGDVQWPTSNRVLQFLPGYVACLSGGAKHTLHSIFLFRSVETKFEILKHTKKHETAILADRSVHMLMSLLCLFDR